MKKCFATMVICLTISLLFTGCQSQKAEQKEAPQMTQIGNPWSNRSTVEEAEEKVAFSFGLAEVIDERYTVERIRTMNSELIEVVYRYEEDEVCVRKKKGEGEDISGDFNQYETCAEESRNGGTVTRYFSSEDHAIKLVISYQGYSWSLVASNGYQEGSEEAFLNQILK